MKRKRKREEKQKREYWTHPIFLKRPTEGAWKVLIMEFRERYPSKHKESLRVSVEGFDHILHMIRPYIEKKDTRCRKAISPEQRLCVTLMFLALGDSFKTLSNLFRMGQTSIRRIVYITCHALSIALRDTYLKTPSTEDEWRRIAHGYVEFNFNVSTLVPQCLCICHSIYTIECSVSSLYINYFHCLLALNGTGTSPIVLVQLMASTVPYKLHRTQDQSSSTTRSTSGK